jgi:hypothetical protein
MRVGTVTNACSTGATRVGRKRRLNVPESPMFNLIRASNAHFSAQVNVSVRVIRLFDTLAFDHGARTRADTFWSPAGG